MLVDPCRLALTVHNPKLLATNSAVIDASIRHLALDFFATAGMHTPACDAVLGVVHALATTRRRKAWCADGRWHILFMEAEGSNNTRCVSISFFEFLMKFVNEIWLLVLVSFLGIQKLR